MHKGGDVRHQPVMDMSMLKTIETILAEHQAFGNGDYINQQLQVCYRRRLTKISAYLPVAGKLLNALNSATAYSTYRIIGDTVVRCAIQHALKQLETGIQYGFPLNDCEEVFEATISHLEQGRPDSPIAAESGRVNRLGLEPYHGWIWSETHPDNVFGRCFRWLIKDNYGDSSLSTLDADEVAKLAKGTKLLEDLLPILSRSALSHAHLIAVFPAVGNWKGKASSSQFRMAGTIFLSREILQSPWLVAEYLFHESLHQKLYDFRHGHSLFKPNYWQKNAPMVCSLWNVPDVSKSNYWDTHRAVAAFHVYVHLSLLCTVAEQRRPHLEKVYGPRDGSFTLIESRKALDRAHYLGEQIRQLCWQKLGLAGKRFIDWLISVLDVLDPAPPPENSYIHLLVDLYQRDTHKIEDLLRKADFVKVPSDLSKELIDVIDNEVKSTRSLLSVANAEDVLSRFDTAVARYSRAEFGKKFSEIRKLISKTLLEFSPDGDGLKCSMSDSTSPDEIAKQMVQGSSRRLDRIISTYA